MKNVFKLLGITMLALVIGCTMMACGGGGGGDPDPGVNGVVSGSFNGTPGTITVTQANTWTLSVPSIPYTESGTYERYGNVLQLKTAEGENLGTATVNGTDITITLNSNAGDFAGTYDDFTWTGDDVSEEPSGEEPGGEEPGGEEPGGEEPGGEEPGGLAADIDPALRNTSWAYQAMPNAWTMTFTNDDVTWGGMMSTSFDSMVEVYEEYDFVWVFNNGKWGVKYSEDGETETHDMFTYTLSGNTLTISPIGGGGSGSFVFTKQ